MEVARSLFRKIPQGFLHIFSQFFSDHRLFLQSFYATELSLSGDFLSVQILPLGLYLFKIREEAKSKDIHIWMN